MEVTSLNFASSFVYCDLGIMLPLNESPETNLGHYGSPMKSSQSNKARTASIIVLSIVGLLSVVLVLTTAILLGNLSDRVSSEDAGYIETGMAKRKVHAMLGPPHSERSGPDSDDDVYFVWGSAEAMCLTYTERNKVLWIEWTSDLSRRKVARPTSKPDSALNDQTNTDLFSEGPPKFYFGPSTKKSHEAENF